MIVYVEYVFLDNLAMDCLLLWLALVTLKIGSRWYRVALGGVVGAICSVVSVYFNGIWLILCKLVTLVVMSISVVGIGKKLFWYVLLVLAYTFLMGGAIIGLFNMFSIDYLSNGTLMYNTKLPLFVYLFAVLLVCFLCYSLHMFVLQTKKVAPHLCKAAVNICGKSYFVTAYLDSGNTLEYKGTSVCFVTKKFGDISSFFSQQILTGKAERVSVVTVGGITTVFAVPCEISANGTQQNVLLALPASKCNTHYNILLNNSFGGDQ